MQQAKDNKNIGMNEYKIESLQNSRDFIKKYIKDQPGVKLVFSTERSSFMVRFEIDLTFDRYLFWCLLSNMLGDRVVTLMECGLRRHAIKILHEIETMALPKTAACTAEFDFDLYEHAPRDVDP